MTHIKKSPQPLEKRKTFDLIDSYQLNLGENAKQFVNSTLCRNYNRITQVTRKSISQEKTVYCVRVYMNGFISPINSIKFN